MLLLDNDCICKIYKSYINNFIKCKKNNIELKKFMFCKKIYDISKIRLSYNKYIKYRFEIMYFS